MSAPSICPNCFERVPPPATACPGCGSDEQTGWSPAAGYAHTLPEDTRPRRSRRTAAWAIGIVAILVVVALLAGLIGNVYGVIALALVLLAALWLRLSRPTAASPSARPQSAGFDRLVALCYDDREMAERLVAGEERRLSGGARPILVKRAIERLIADRRR